MSKHILAPWLGKRWLALVVSLFFAILFSACAGVGSDDNHSSTPTVGTHSVTAVAATPTPTPDFVVVTATPTVGFTPTPTITPSPTPETISVPGLPDLALSKVMYSTLQTNWSDWFASGKGWALGSSQFTYQNQAFSVTTAVQSGDDNGENPPSWKTNTHLRGVANYTVAVTVQYGDALGCTDIADLLYSGGKGYKISPNCDGYNELRPVEPDGSIGTLTVGTNQILSNDQPNSIHTFFAWHTAKDQVCFAEDVLSHFFCMPTDHHIATKSGGEMGANSAQTQITLLQYSVVNWTPPM